MNRIILIVIAAAFVFISACQNDSQPQPSVPAPPATTGSTTTEPVAPLPAEVADKAEVAGESPESLGSGFSSGQSSGLSKEFLSGQKFRLVRINQADYSGEMVPSLEFGDDFQVFGQVCNTFRGQGLLNDGILKTEMLVTTRMACLNENLTQLESSFMKMLENGVNISMDGNLLYLRDDSRTLVFQADNSAP